MNANFAAVKAAVDDNNARITSSETRLTGLEGRVTTLETQPAWIAVSGGAGFNTGWSNVGGGNAAAAYFKDSHGVIHLRGRVKRTSGTAVLIFTLPAGYRPASIEAFATEATNAFGQITVYTDGKVQLDFGAVSYCSISGITFDTR